MRILEARFIAVSIFTLIYVSCTVIKAQAPNLWGLNEFGPGNNHGGIFNIKGDGTGFALNATFAIQAPGDNPNIVVLDDNGKLYGVTYQYNGQLIFSFDTVTKVATDVYDLINSDTGIGSLIKASSGKLYGTGAIARAEQYYAIHIPFVYFFNPVTNTINYLDSLPFAQAIQDPLTEGNNGKLYGIAARVNNNNGGIVFSFDTVSNLVSPLDTLPGNNFSYTAANPLCLGADGKMYGTIVSGGAYSKGCIYSYDPGLNTCSILFNFNNTDGPGYKPVGAMVQNGNGKFYGVCDSGGVAGKGSLYSFDPITDSCTKVYDFETANGAYEHQSFFSSLLSPISSGKYLGIAQVGGLYNDGTIYSYDVDSNIFTKLYDFDGRDGSTPYSVPVPGANGKWYGVTLGGGNYLPDNSDGVYNGAGVVYSIEPATDNYTRYAQFQSVAAGTPSSRFIRGSDEKFYTTTQSGGTFDYGTLICFDPSTDNYTVLHNFNDTDGATPFLSPLVQASDGKLYGVTLEGGIHSFEFNGYGNYPPAGVLFSYDLTTNTYTKLHDFDSLSGNHPQGSLIQLADGKLYGTCRDFSNDQTDSTACIYSFDPATGIYTEHYKFGPHGSFADMDPFGGLVLNTDGLLYGLSQWGGMPDHGMIYSYNPATDSVKKIFNCNYQLNPMGNIVMLAGKFYCISQCGGSSNNGTIFCYNPATDTAITLFSFNGTGTGATPEDGLLHGSDGNLYGTTAAGGASGEGVIFKFNPDSNTYTKLMDLDKATVGETPLAGLFELPPCFIPDTVNIATCNYGYNFMGHILDSSGTYFDTSFIQSGCDTVFILNLNIIQPVYSFINADICWGSSYSFNGHYLNVTGLYTDTVTASSGCDSIITLQLTIHQPFFDTLSSAICQGDTYYFNNTPLASGGTYIDTFYTSFGCDSIWVLLLTVNPNPEIVLNDTFQAVCANQSVTYVANPLNGETFVWSDSLNNLLSYGNTFTIAISVPGLYMVSATDSIGLCSSQFQVSVNIKSAPNQDLCLVTSDSLLYHNIIVWDKADKYATDSFYIYRTVTPDTSYIPIALISRDSLSVYEDFSSRSDSMSYRYKINLKDTCGNFSALSNYHQTIYLQYIGNGVFQWTPYLIENDNAPISSYDLYRDAQSNGNWVLLNSYPSTQTTGTIADYALYPNASYRIIVTLANPCNPTRSISYISSNIINHIINSIHQLSSAENIRLRYNPVYEMAEVINIEQPANLQLMDNLGQILQKSYNAGNNIATFNLQNYSSGVYYIVIEIDGAKVTLKVVKY